MKTTLLILIAAVLFPLQNVTAQDKMEAPADIQIEKKAPASSYLEVRYYYYPNMEAYFDTQRALYIVKQNGVWTTSETLDFTSRGYCVRNGAYEMIKDYTGDEPFAYLAVHKLKYPANFSSRPQKPAKTEKFAKSNNAIATAE